ncbi:MAG: DUF5348 domain-containing protein [Clostridium sp.]|nr:DUF5348 domain-containing protein [Clostridium sp.]
MEKKTGTLRYNYNNKKMGIMYKMDLWIDNGLNSGKSIEVFIDNKWINDVIELSREGWYLVYSKLQGADLEGLKVRFIYDNGELI